MTDLLTSVPSNGEVPELEYRYDETPPGNKIRVKIRCAHCHRQQHWRGNVAKYADGTRILLGRDCGEEQFGFSWNTQEDRFNERLDRRNLLLHLEGLTAALPLIRAFLEVLLANPALQSVCDAQDELRAKMPEIISILTKTIHGSGGELQITERVRDIAAELRRDEQQKFSKNPETKPLFKRIKKSLGRLAGASFILDHSMLPTEVERLLAACAEVDGQLTNMTSETLSEGRDLLNATEAIIKSIDRIIERITAADRFFSLANLRTITDWLRKRMGLKDYSASTAAFCRVGGTTSARVTRRAFDIPMWRSREHILQLLSMTPTDA